MPNIIDLNLLDNKSIVATMQGYHLANENSYKIIAGEKNATIFSIKSLPVQYENARLTVEMVNAKGCGVEETDIGQIEVDFDTYIGFSLPVGMAVAGYGYILIRAYLGNETVPFQPLKIKVWNTIPQWQDYVDKTANAKVVDGYLILTENGNEYNLGYVQGDKGDKGDTGEKGDKGADGYTPIRGVDYFTPQDEKDWQAYIANELAKRGQLKPEFANSIEDLKESGDISKLYVLPDGYIYAYMTKTTAGGTEEVVVDVTEGFVDNTRLSVSSGNPSSLTGHVTTPFIDMSQYPIDTEIRLSGIDWAASANNTNGYALVTYNESKSMVTPLYLYLGEHGDAIPNMKYIANSANDVVFKAYNTDVEFGFKYVRFCGKGSSANAVVKVVYSKETPSQTITEWTNTGLAFVPADYENRIIDLEIESADHEERIERLETEAVDNVPSYWLEELRTKADTIQQAMESAGRNKSAFLWYTDAHWKTNSKKSPLLLKYLAENTPINKVNFGGDIINDPSPFTHENIKYAYEWRKLIAGLPNHHSVYGNHDVNAASFTERKMAYSYILAPEETPEMVVGGESYYYIDNPSEKTRYLYLSFYTTSSNFSNHLWEQGRFIAQAISSVAEGWHIVVIAHRWFQYDRSSAPTVGVVPAYEAEILQLFDEYNARGTHKTLNYIEPQDFTNAKGKVEFCIGGHIHVDYDFTTNGGIPVILTASDTNQDRSPDEDEDSGTLGTTTESAVFGVIANYDNNKITIVGVGRGGSRTINI